MDITTGVADLHLHTTASDGTSSVAERVTQAADRDLATIAITDHDIIADDLTGRVTGRDGVEVITGVEVRADVFDTKIELLGYYVDPTEPTLRDALEQARSFRHERNEAMVANLATETELDLDYDEIRADADGMVGRPHLAELLVDHDVADSVGAAFEEYLGTEGDVYVPMERLPAYTVIDAIHAAEGICSLAHPGRIRSDRVPEMVETLAAAGLDGIEVRYPYDASGGPDAYAHVDADDAARLAETYDLLETGGSDCHGPGSGKFRLGEVRVRKGTLEALRTTVDV
jgi:predicted metal-dependent phosphoesterase TrpH